MTLISILYAGSRASLAPSPIPSYFFTAVMKSSEVTLVPD